MTPTFRSLVFIPEGNVTDPRFFSGISCYFYQALLAECQRQAIELHVISFAECLELEELIKLYCCGRDAGAVVSKRIRKKSAEWRNGEFIERIGKAVDPESFCGILRDYWAAVRAEVAARRHVDVDPACATLALSPFVPYVGKAENFYLYVDCCQTNFFFNAPHGTLVQLDCPEVIVGEARRTERRVFESARAIASFSRRAREEILGFAEVAPENVISVGAGANLPELPSPDTLRDDPAGRPLRLLFIGLDFRRKGGDTVCSIAQRLQPHNVLVTLVTAGMPEAPLTPNVRLVPPTGKAELAALYREADIFLFPTRFEPFGVVLCEAMAFGLPVVGSNVGALPELLGGVDGNVLCDPEDLDGLTAGVQRLLENRLLRQQAGAANRRRVDATYNWPAAAQRILRIIEDTRD